jgi:hypothetical protein
MPADRFTDYARDEESRLSLEPLPDTLRSDLVAALERGYDALWSEVGAVMRAHGIPGDDLGWDDSEARSEIARAVVRLVAPNRPPNRHDS